MRVDTVDLCSLRVARCSVCDACTQGCAAAAKRAPLMTLPLQEHTINACQERPVGCAFSCCDVTFPLSSRVNQQCPHLRHSWRLLRLTRSQGMHNKDAVAAHADYLLQQYIRRQRILEEINERAAALVSSNNQKFAHVAAVNAGLVSDAAKVR